MLARPPRDKKLAAERRRARNRVLLRQHRERERRGLSIAHVIYDGATLDLLIRDGFLTDTQAFDKTMIDAALSKYLWNASHAK